jgi:hypothetical protein
MAEPLALFDNCKSCGGAEATAESWGDHAWMDCVRCGGPVITWGDYKRQALELAAAQLRRQSKAKAASRR